MEIRRLDNNLSEEDWIRKAHFRSLSKWMELKHPKFQFLKICIIVGYFFAIIRLNQNTFE